MKKALAALPLALAALALAGCTGAPDDGKDAGNDAAAVKFVACLNDEGQTAKIIEGGQVGMLMPEGGLGSADSSGGISLGGEGGAPEGGPAVTVGISMDEDGTWMAASAAEAYPEEGGYREAWATCAAEIPEFEQPVPDMGGAGGGGTTLSSADTLEKSLAFAECARGEGYADFPDPADNGMIDFPLMGEDEFRSLLDACLDPEDGMFGVSISPESAEQFDFDWFAVMAEFMGGNIMMGTAVPVAPVG
jgi:hypothetical protein